MKRRFLIIVVLLSAVVSASAQGLEAVSQSIDCGQVVYRMPLTAEFDVRNKSGKTLRIDEVRKSCGCTSVAYPQGEIVSGAAFKVRAIYDAAQMGHFNKQIALYGSGQKEPLILTLKGIVVEEVVDYSGSYPFKLGNILAEKTHIEFDDVNRGDRPTQKIHLMNTSDKSVQPVLMHLPAYLKAEVSPSNIRPGHSGVATITLDSRALRNLGLTQTTVYLGMFPGDKVSASKEIGISAVLLPNFDDLSSAAKAQAPQIQLSATTLDFGTVDGRKVKKGEIDIANTGKSMLDIRSLQMFTAGLHLSLNKTKIEPGETAKLKITADEKQLRNARTTPRVLMITNDPDRPKVTITIQVK